MPAMPSPADSKAAADPLADPLADLRARFVARSRERFAELAAIVAEPTLEASALERLVRLAHQLAGSAGTFGCAELGRAAACLEEMARAHLAPGQDVGPAVAARLGRRLLVVENELAALQPSSATAMPG